MLLYNYGNTLIYLYLDLQSDTINYPYTYSLILAVQPTPPHWSNASQGPKQ
jgi:hypothetical protein